MRRLLLITLYLVTWKTFKAELVQIEVDNVNVSVVKTFPPRCELKSESHQEEFQDWFKAAARASALKNESANYDVKTWELDEPVGKERK